MRLLEAFADELEKIAISHGRWTVPKSRSGRRPISVSNLLKKEKDGSLYKRATLEDPRMKRRLERLLERRGEIDVGVLDPVLKPWVEGKLAAAVTEQASAVYQEVDPKNPTVSPKAKFLRGDVPAREDIPGRTGAEYKPDVSGSTASRGLAPEGYSTY
jgi:hypothetical protein